MSEHSLRINLSIAEGRLYAEFKELGYDPHGKDLKLFDTCVQRMNLTVGKVIDGFSYIPERDDD